MLLVSCIVSRKFYVRIFVIAFRFRVVEARNLRYEYAASDGIMFTFLFLTLRALNLNVAKKVLK